MVRARTALGIACGLFAVMIAGAAALASRGIVAPVTAAAALALLAVLIAALLRAFAASALVGPEVLPRAEAGMPEDVVPVSALADLVTWHDRQGDVLRASPLARAVLGTPCHALRGDGFLMRVHIADRPAFLKALSDAAHGRGGPPIEIRVLAEAPDGIGQTLVRAEMRARPLPLPAAPGAAAVIALTRDLSAQHRQTDDLLAARREAEKASEVKGRFLATASHELRTPLNAIIGFSELLGADHPYLVTEERRKEYANIIRSSGQHLLEIVNTLLDMSKIEAGHAGFDPEALDIRDLAAGVCDLMQVEADAAGVRLERRFDLALPEVMADRRACRQVLINLLSNAVKFTPAGGAVTIRLAPAGDAVVLSVADSGIGIPEADLPRLGDPFFRSGDVHGRNEDGTGLGLSVVRGIVGLHQGTIEVESGAGAGTTVTVTLPLRPDLAPERSRPVILQTRPRVAVRPIERKIA